MIDYFLNIFLNKSFQSHHINFHQKDHRNIVQISKNCSMMYSKSWSSIQIKLTSYWHIQVANVMFQVDRVRIESIQSQLWANFDLVCSGLSLWVRQF